MPPTGSHACRSNRHRDVQNSKSLNNYKICLNCGALINPRHRRLITPRHKYSSLRFDDEIRLILLHPGSGKSDLLCELVPVRLKEKPSYEAVSYTWADSNGDSSLCRNIFTTSPRRKLRIARNCEAALRNFRDTKTKRYLWVDSVCIDQHNVQERNSQVKMMTDIYSGAIRVLVYLDNGQAPQALESEERLRRLFEYMRNDICDQSGWFCRNHPVSGPHLPISKVLLDKSLNKEVHKDLRRFLKNRWFSRVWVLQEIVRAKDVVLFCGSFSLNWGHFTMDLFEINNLSLQHLDVEIPPVLRLGKGLTRNTVDLVDLLFSTRPCGATDPRDKVFALLGIYMSLDSDALQPDYSKSVEDVFKEATLYCIRQTNSLRVLSLVGFPTESRSSWVPDLSIQSSLLRLAWWRQEWANYIGKFRWNPDVDLYRTMEPCDPENRVPVISYCPPNALEVRGVYLDEVVRAGGLFRDSAFDKAEPLRGLPPWWMRASLEEFTTEFWKRIGQSTVNETNHFFSENQVPWTFKHCEKVGFVNKAARKAASKAAKEAFANVDWLAIDLLAPLFERRATSTPIYCPLVTQQFLWLVENFAQGRKLLSTRHSLAIGPPFAKEGDLIYSIDGAGAPFVVRRQADHYIFLGEAILQEPMDHPQGLCKTDFYSGCNCHTCSGYRLWKTARQKASLEIISLR